MPMANTIIHLQHSEINLCMRLANERWRYTVTPSLIGWAHTQNGPQAFIFYISKTTPMTKCVDINQTWMCLSGGG